MIVIFIFRGYSPDKRYDKSGNTQAQDHFVLVFETIIQISYIRQVRSWVQVLTTLRPGWVGLLEKYLIIEEKFVILIVGKIALNITQDATLPIGLQLSHLITCCIV